MVQQRNKEETRLKMRVAASRSFRAHGFAGVGVDGIAKEAGVTSGAFYSHFGSKDGAFSAALGVGLPVDEPIGNMIVDIGGGTTEVAVVSLNGIVESRSVRVGGDTMDAGIVRYIKRSYSLLIGERTAENIKINIGSAYPMAEELEMEVKGRDLNGGLPKTITINSAEIREALLEPISSIVEAVRVNLERCPPELASDLVDHGIVLAGGGSKLRGLDQLLAEETGLPVTLADEPLLAVARGTGIYLEGLDKYRRRLS